MEDHPLVIWYAALKRADAASMEGSDIVLGDLGGKRFAIGIEEGTIPLLCCAFRDKEAVASVKWTSAAFVFGHKERDWVALSCKDVRTRDSQQMNPVPLRLWIPVTTGMLEAWAEIKPAKLKVGAMKATKKGPPALFGEPFTEVTLKIIGR